MSIGVFQGMHVRMKVSLGVAMSDFIGSTMYPIVHLMFLQAGWMGETFTTFFTRVQFFSSVNSFNMFVQIALV